MCGIAGCLTPGARAQELAEQVRAMSATIVHRGPDAHDALVIEHEGLAFGFQRLAIVDLTPTGMQPMTSHSGRYTVVFNGEVYNHRDLRGLLANTPWRGTSDTEVMLAAFERWGVRETLHRVHGMFAIALWDHQERSLTLVRDRRGEKPLYYGLQHGALLFGSELKALRAHPAFRSDLDRDALAAFMYASFVPSAMSIWEGTKKLPAANMVTIRPSDVTAGVLPDPECYWHLPARTSRTVGDFEAIESLDHHLREVIGRQLVADVPVGAFLSGGIDSSTIVALAQAISNQPLKTYTIGIPEDRGLDESLHAKAVAAHLGTDHHSLQVTPAEAREIIPGLGTMYDEPFADASQIPTHIVSRMARRDVTVALSGDGGDELFGGYRRYTLAPRVANRVRHIPRWLAAGGRASLRSLSARTYDRLRPGLGDEVHQIALLLSSTNADDVYLNVFGSDPRRQLVTGRTFDARSLFRNAVPENELDSDAIDRMMRFDALVYIPDDICVKVDRAAMAVSLETRMPYLDHGIAELAWNLPQHVLIRDGVTKWVLRQVLARYVPPALTERPKAGFGLPIAAWLRGPLREWADDLLSAEALAHGHLDTDAVRKLWKAHRSGRHNYTRVLWNTLMFQEWLTSGPATGSPTAL